MLQPISEQKKKGAFFFQAGNPAKNKINGYVNGINDALKAKEWDKAEQQLKKLVDYIYKKINSKHRDPAIMAWFEQNPLYSVTQKIMRCKALDVVRNHPNARDMFNQLTSNDALASYISSLLSGEIDNSQYRLKNLGGENNQVVYLSVGDEEYVCRFYRVLKQEKQNRESSLDAVHRLSKLDAVVYPDLMVLVKDCDDQLEEQVYLELSEYFSHGTLEDYFNQLHKNNADNKTIQMECLDFTNQFLSFFKEISTQGVWYTDLKPSNVLLNEKNRIRISDTKGFVISDEPLKRINRCGVTANYHDVSCYEDKFLKLPETQQKTLAATLYHLMTNRPPERSQEGSEWQLKFDFDKPVFSGKYGQKLKQLITDLYNVKFKSWDEVMDNSFIQTAKPEAASSSAVTLRGC